MLTRTLISHANRGGLASVALQSCRGGYSGQDTSIMVTLTEAVNRDGALRPILVFAHCANLKVFP